MLSVRLRKLKPAPATPLPAGQDVACCVQGDRVSRPETYPLLSGLSMRSSPGRSEVFLLILPSNISSHPAHSSAFRCNTVFWSFVDTLTYPMSNVYLPQKAESMPLERQMVIIKNIGFRPLHFNHMGCVAFLFALLAISIFRSVATVRRLMRFGAKNFAALHRISPPQASITNFHWPEKPQ